MSKRIAWLILLLLPVLAGGVLAWLGWTASGLQFAVTRVRDALPTGVTLGAVSGRLSGPLRIEQLSVTQPGVTLRSGPIELDWSPGALLGGTLHITRLTVAAVQLQVMPQADTDDDAPLQWPERLPLPLTIVLDHADMQAVQLHMPGLPEALVLDNVQLAGRASEQGVSLQRLVVQGKQAQAKGAVSITLGQPVALHAALEVQLNLPSWPALHGQLNMDGSLAALNADVQISGPFDLRLTAKAQDVLHAAGWQGRLQVSGFTPAVFWPESPAYSLGVDIVLQGDWQQLAMTGTLTAAGTPAGALQAQINSRLTAQTLTVQSLELQSDALPTVLKADGTLALQAPFAFTAQGGWQNLTWHDTPVLSEAGHFTLQGSAQELNLTLDARAGAEQPNLHASGMLNWAQAMPQFTADLDWRDLTVPLAARQYLASAQGRLHLAGTTAAYAVQGNAALRWPGLPAGALTVTATGDTRHLQVEQFSFDWLDGQVTGNGQLAWEPALTWRADINVRDLNPQVLAAAWPGSLGGRFTLHGETTADAPAITLQVHELSGSLRQQPLSGNGVVRWRNQVLQADNLQLGWADATLALDGTRQAVHAVLNIPAVQRLDERGAGSLHAEGSWRGGLLAPQGWLAVRAEGLSWQAAQLAALDVSASLDATQNLTAHGSLRGLQHNALTLDAATLQLDGTLAAHQLQLYGENALGAVQLAAQGGYAQAQAQWQGTLQRADITLTASDVWQLQAAAPLRIGADQVLLQQACWQQAAAQACLDGQWQSAGSWQASAQILALPLAMLHSILPRGLDYHGLVTGQVQARGDAQALRLVDAHFTLADGALGQSVDGSAVTLLAFEQGQLDLQLQDNQAQATLNFNLPDQGYVKLTAGLTPVFNAPRERQKITAYLTANTHEFGLIPILFPDIASFSGDFQADLRADGSLAAPRLHGYAAFTDGAARLPRLGLQLDKVNLRLDGTGRGVRLQGGAVSDGGRVDWELTLQHAQQWQGAGSLQGENFLALNTPEVRIRITPDFKLDLRGRDIQINGTLHVPEARIAPRDLSGTVQVSPDQIIVNRPASKTTDKDWRLHADVRTVLGKAVHFTGFGLKARITGAVRTIEEPGQLTLAQGELRIEDGEYTAYGQQLAIETGRLIYNSAPINNPALDIRAVRRVQEVLVGLNIRGTLRRPQLNLFSDPALSQTQQLAYLILGRPLNEASNAEQQRLGSAAATLGLAGSALLAGAVGRRFGIEDVAIESTGPGNQAALVLGSYLSPRLYLSYGIGLFDAVNTMRLRYELSSKWLLVAESGDYTSADFLYTIETD